MRNDTAITFETKFEEEVFTGLTTYPKHLSSKYFYDAIGDKLFQDIMQMPEYYLTNAEFEIFETYKKEITQRFIGDDNTPFELVELGAGNGKKTKILLGQLVSSNVNFTYRPIDISTHVLSELTNSLEKELPQLRVAPECGQYFEALKRIDETHKSRKVILFLGSNIGNLLHEQAIPFLREVYHVMQEGDLLFMGLDLKKNPKTILDAYNDNTGITAAFNKNILRRINRELGGTFDLEQFLHWEVYNPESGTAKSYLVSKQQQTVHIDKLKLNVEFAPWETIHTEISQKYDDATVRWLAKQAGLTIVSQYRDAHGLFGNYLFTKNK